MTEVSLRDFVDARIKSLEEALRLEHVVAQEAILLARSNIEEVFRTHSVAHSEQHHADQEALRLAREALNLRLEKLNELRNEVTQDRAMFVTRDSFEATMKQQLGAVNASAQGREDKIARLNEWQNKAESQLLAIARFETSVDALEAKSEAAIATLDARYSASFKSMAEKFDERLKPIERVVGRVGLLLAGSTAVGGLIVFLVQKALST